ASGSSAAGGAVVSLVAGSAAVEAPGSSAGGDSAATSDATTGADGDGGADADAIGRLSRRKPRDFRTSPSSSAEQPRIDIMSSVALNPPSPVEPLGGASARSGDDRQASNGRIRSAKRSRMSRRTARGPQTWKPWA